MTEDLSPNAGETSRDAPSPGAALRPELDPIERRVLGVLVEKSLATPGYYPMTTKALVAGCNQRNNRDPVTQYGEDDVRDALTRLQGKRMVMAVRPEGGHATRWRHELDRRFTIQGREDAILAELLLRGPQTEGELRARASRMSHIPDLETLHETMDPMRRRLPPLVVRLSPEGAVRGVKYAHALYPDAELQQLADADRSGGVAEVVSQLPASETSQLRTRIAALERRLDRIEAFLGRELGATFPGETAGESAEDES